jgi:hypothetical protein
MRKAGSDLPASHVLGCERYRLVPPVLLVPLLHVPETFFTLVTLNICPDVPAPAEPVAACEPAEDPVDALAPEPEALPFTSTSWLTWSLSFDVSPDNWYCVPEASVKA